MSFVGRPKILAISVGICSTVVLLSNRFCCTRPFLKTFGRVMWGTNFLVTLLVTTVRIGHYCSILKLFGEQICYTKLLVKLFCNSFGLSKNECRCKDIWK